MVNTNKNTNADTARILSDWKNNGIPLYLWIAVCSFVHCVAYSLGEKNERNVWEATQRWLVSTPYQFEKEDSLTSELTLCFYSNKNTKGFQIISVVFF